MTKDPSMMFKKQEDATVSALKGGDGDMFDELKMSKEGLVADHML